jgi:chromatin modification-related protein VID21
MHDTHGQYNKMPRYTPAELSRMKTDKDQKEQEQIHMVRQRQELQRQQLLQANRMPLVGPTMLEIPLS